MYTLSKYKLICPHNILCIHIRSILSYSSHCIR
nr:MAG TPA: hypothetical protein [Bacteriophage sp.]